MAKVVRSVETLVHIIALPRLRHLAKMAREDKAVSKVNKVKAAKSVAIRVRITGLRLRPAKAVKLAGKPVPAAARAANALAICARRLGDKLTPASVMGCAEP